VGFKRIWLEANRLDLCVVDCGAEQPSIPELLSFFCYCHFLSIFNAKRRLHCFQWFESSETWDRKEFFTEREKITRQRRLVNGREVGWQLRWPGHLSAGCLVNENVVVLQSRAQSLVKQDSRLAIAGQRAHFGSLRGG